MTSKIYDVTLTSKKPYEIFLGLVAESEEHVLQLLKSVDERVEEEFNIKIEVSPEQDEKVIKEMQDKVANHKRSLN